MESDIVCVDRAPFHMIVRSMTSPFTIVVPRRNVKRLRRFVKEEI